MLITIQVTEALINSNRANSIVLDTVRKLDNALFSVMGVKLEHNQVIVTASRKIEEQILPCLCNEYNSAMEALYSEGLDFEELTESVECAC